MYMFILFRKPQFNVWKLEGLKLILRTSIFFITELALYLLLLLFKCTRSETNNTMH